MRTLFSATAIAAALTIGLCVPGDAHMGGMGGAPASAFASAHASVGFHGRGFGFHHRFLPPAYLFHQSHFDFGKGFRSHQPLEAAGGYGGDDTYGPDADYDIDNLHFRVEEPFGPGDIGRRPPVREEGEGPYESDRMDPWHEYAPD